MNVPSTQLSRDDIDALCSSSSTSLSQQVAGVTEHIFQQAINCCGLTSVAYALTALGFPTTVDDIFLSVGISVDSAVGDGMTLAEIHDASSRYVARKSLPVFVECYHFDGPVTSSDAFATAVKADAAAGLDDLLILNFHSGIAHGWPSGGGGHFSVLLGSRGEEDLVMADVHAMKYGAFWAAPASQLYAAMADHDSCGRARGAIRFGRTDKEIERPLRGLTPTLVDWTAPKPPHTSEALQRYVPSGWDEGLGSRNMEGVSALSAGLRLLCGDKSPLSSLDGVMQELRESYTSHLNAFLGQDDILRMANTLRKKGAIKAVATAHSFAAGDAGALKSALMEAGCGEEGVIILAAYDINVARGYQLVKKAKGEAGALCHGVKTWSLIAAVDKDADVGGEHGIMLAPAHNVILAGRLWATSIEKMAKAIEELTGDGESSFVVLDARN